MNNTKATMPLTFDSIFKQRRIAFPKRTSNLVALIALSTTLFLFLHTRDLNTKLRRMEGRLSSSADASSYNQLTGDHSGSASGRHSERMLKSAQEQKEHDKLNEVDSRLPEEHIQEEQQYQDDTPSPHQLNNTLRANIEVVFFNRVPKVGSQTFMELLRRLAMRNEFTFVRDAVQRVETIRLAPREQRALVDMVSTLQTPAAYVKHVCYTNFSMYGYPEPIYINVVRDPIERVISWYYYVRAPWYYVERKRAFPDLPLPDPQWLKKDFESCVMNGDRECRYQQGETHEGIGDHRRQTLFFCGHEEECTPFNTNGALERAKRAVEERYAVVGVLEDMNATLSAFEHYVPRFFAGASSVYWDELNRINKINRNAFKPPVSEAVKDIVRANFTREIEFYQFCRQRLYRQLRALRLPLS